MKGIRIVFQVVVLVTLSSALGCIADADDVLGSQQEGLYHEGRWDHEELWPLWPEIGETDVGPAAEECRPDLRGRVKVEVYGCWGHLSGSDVEIWRDDRLIDLGRAFAWLDVDDCPDNVVVVGDLADNPSVPLEDYAVDYAGERRIEEVGFDTGLLRVRAYVGRRRISGVAWIYRIDESGRVGTSPVGTISLNNVTREISAGTYELRAHYYGRTLVERVTIRSCGSRRVALRG